MTNARIFLISSDGETLVPMEETPYEREDILQHLLTRYPDLLPGDQINPDEPRRWLLVKREMGVPKETGGSDSWSLDHLFIDQDGIPTFVECKLEDNTDIRRKVVAQMLEYAANGTKYWPIDRLRQEAAETAQDWGMDLDEKVGQLIGLEDEADIEQFWQQVEENLIQGRVRLLFVADKIPSELRRIVEFLNEKMADVEVLSVEIKQFEGSGHNAIAPRIIGQTEAARRSSQGLGVKRRDLNRASFKARCLEQCGPAVAEFFDWIAIQADQISGFKLYWGTTRYSVRLYVKEEDEWATFAYCVPSGEFSFYAGSLRDQIGEDAMALREELAELGLLAKAGQLSLKGTVSEANVEQFREFYALLIKKVSAASGIQ